MAKHRVEFMQLRRAAAQLVFRHAQAFRQIGEFRLFARQEFMQRRVEQADRHRQALHDLE